MRYINETDERIPIGSLNREEGKELNRMKASYFPDEQWRPLFPYELEAEDRLEAKRVRQERRRETLRSIRSRMPNKSKAILCALIVMVFMSMDPSDAAARGFRRCGGFFRGRCHRGFFMRRRCRVVRHRVRRFNSCAPQHFSGPVFHEAPVFHGPPPAHNPHPAPVLKEREVPKEKPAAPAEVVTPPESEIPQEAY